MRYGSAQPSGKIGNGAKLFWMKWVCILWAESVRGDAASESVVDLNKMFFWGELFVVFGHPNSGTSA